MDFLKQRVKALELVPSALRTKIQGHGKRDLIICPNKEKSNNKIVINK